MASLAPTAADGYQAALEGCALIDRSERGKLALSGPGAVEFLNGQVTNELEGIRAGEGRYAAFLTHKGKMLGDVRILAVGPEPGGEPAELLLDTERVALQALFDMIRRYRIGFDLELHKRTLERGLVSLLGPHARELACATSLGEREHENAQTRVGGVQGLAIRTDAGIDLLHDSTATARLLEALREAGAVALSEHEDDCLRIESGRPRYGVDLDDSVIPQEAGLNERAVSFTKGCYVGQETVARLFYKGKPNRHLRGLRLSAPVAPGAALRMGEREVGTLSSAALSPRLGPLGLALVRREAGPGEQLMLEGGAQATVVELPFPAGR